MRGGLVVLGVWLAVGAAAAAPDKPASKPAPMLTGAVKKVRVAGASDALRAQIEAAVATVVGGAPDADRLRDPLSQVMKLPGVADVLVEGVQLAAGIELVITVTPQPVMHALAAVETGGKAIPLGIAAVPNNTPFDPLRIQTLVGSLRDRYLADGYFDVAVTWRRSPAAGGVDVVIEVTPGVAATIGGVAFRGNTIASKLLEPQVGKLLVVGQPAVATKLDAAVEALLHHYWDQGYANVKIRSPKPVAGRNPVVFDIEEGPQFRIGTIKVTGIPDAEHARNLALFGVKRGDLFSRTAIANGRQRIIDALVATGHRGAEVTPLTKVDTPRRTIALTLEILTGP